MTHTKKNAPQVAQVEKNANADANAEQKKNARANNKERAKKDAPKDAPKGAPQVEPTNAPTNAPKADAKAVADAKKAEKNARATRAVKVCEHIKEDARTLSGVLRSVWLRATDLENADATQQADANAIREDFKAVTGVEMPNTRREFAQIWLGAVVKYATAQDADGNAVTIKARAGLVWAVDFVPSLRSCWSEVVANWVRALAPMEMARGAYYTRTGRTLSKVAKTTAEKTLKEYEKRAKAIADAKAQAGADARAKWDGLAGEKDAPKAEPKKGAPKGAPKA